MVGPNNSGKTTLLQALSLWEVGMKKIYEQKGKNSGRTKRVGIAINRKELLSIPVSYSGFVPIAVRLLVSEWTVPISEAKKFYRVTAGSSAE